MNAAQNNNPTKNDQNAKLIPEDSSEKSDAKISVAGDSDLPEKKQHALGKACSLGCSIYINIDSYKHGSWGILWECVLRTLEEKN